MNRDYGITIVFYVIMVYRYQSQLLDRDKIGRSIIDAHL